MKLNSYRDSFLAFISVGLRPKSVLYYTRSLNNILKFVGDREPDKLTTQDVRDWIAWMQTFRKSCNRTIRGDLMIWERLMLWLQDQKIVDEAAMDIFLRRRLPKLPIIKVEKRCITEEEHEAICRVARSGKTKYWWVTSCLMAWHTGLRVSDVAFSKWANIDWEQEIYNETPLKTRRLGKKVTIPLDSELVEWLYALRERPYYVSEYIIPDMAGYYERTNRLDQMFSDLVRRAGVHPDVTFHSYRHAFVSRMLNAGVEAIVISSMTGQTVKQIEDYAHISPLAQRDAIDRARKLLHRDRLLRRGILNQATYQPAIEDNATQLAEQAG